MKAIAKHEVIVHGVEGSQYFQGCGTALTEYADVATGIGDTAQEAYEDALEQLAYADWDVNAARGPIFCHDDHRTVAEVIGEEPADGSELHWFVSVRVAEGRT